MFVSDGLNDGPAFWPAHVSIAPLSAVGIGRNAADFGFLHADLQAVVTALVVSWNALRFVRQNLAFAIIHNVVALPIAFLGLVTPLIAALATSGSSIAVVVNALRLDVIGRRPTERPLATCHEHPLERRLNEPASIPHTGLDSSWAYNLCGSSMVTARWPI